MSNYTANLNGNHHSGVVPPYSGELLTQLNKAFDMVSQPPNSSTSSLDYQALVEELDDKGLAALSGMILLSKEQGRFTLNNLKDKTGLSYTEAKNRIKPFAKIGAVVVELEPQPRYPNMQPTHLYSFADWIDVERFRLAMAGQSRPKIKMDNGKVEEEGKFNLAHVGSPESEAPKTREALRKVFQTINPLYRPAHIQILVWIAELGSITAKKVSEKSGKRHSTTNAQLERVRHLGVSYREKKFGEYYYFLVPGLDKSLVMGLSQEDACQDLPVINTQSENIEPKATQLVADMSSPENPSDPQHSQDKVSFATLVEQFMDVMEKVPACNPSWPQHLQETWINAFERVTRVLDKGTEINKTE